MAERAGFEPARTLPGSIRFPGVPVQPLQHLSAATKKSFTANDHYHSGSEALLVWLRMTVSVNESKQQGLNRSGYCDLVVFLVQWCDRVPHFGPFQY